MWEAVIGAGMSGVGSLFGAASSRQQAEAARQQAEYNRKLQEYHNKMTMLSAAQQQNTITQNTVKAMQASALQAGDIQKQIQAATGSVEVAAAAAGATGKTAQLMQTRVDATGASQEYARQQALENVFDSADQQRKNVALQATMQQDLSWNRAPAETSSPFLDLLGAGTSGLATYTAMGGKFDGSSFKGGSAFSFLGNLFGGNYSKASSVSTDLLGR